MGEMADMLVDQMIDGGGFGGTFRQSRKKTCSLCDERGLCWEKHWGKWVLGSRGKPHTCKAWPAKKPGFSSEN